jgi:hypothetical protein
MAEEKKAKPEAGSLIHLTQVVKKLYTHGSNPRAEKNGNPKALIDNLSAKKLISTCGVFSLLHQRDRDIIHYKKKYQKEIDDPQFRKKIAQIILGCANVYDCKIFCRVSDEGIAYLQAVIDIGNGKVPCKDEKSIRNVVKFTTIFERQERQKIYGF